MASRRWRRLGVRLVLAVAAGLPQPPSAEVRTLLRRDACDRVAPELMPAEFRMVGRAMLPELSGPIGCAAWHGRVEAASGARAGGSDVTRSLRVIGPNGAALARV